MESAKSIVALPAYTLARLGLQKEARELIEALGCPFATTAMEKGLIGEGHPQFAGVYAGAASDEETREIVEEAEVVLDLGGVNLNDITTAAYSARLDPNRFVSLGLNDVRVGQQVFGSVRLADMLGALAKLKSKASPFAESPSKRPV